MDDYIQHGAMVQVSPQLLRQAAFVNPMEEIAREMAADLAYGPRFGPRRVLNDVEQAEEDRQRALVNVLLDLAEEWGVTGMLFEDCY